jgi:hypothetical protein
VELQNKYFNTVNKCQLERENTDDKGNSGQSRSTLVCKQSICNTQGAKPILAFAVMNQHPKFLP